MTARAFTQAEIALLEREKEVLVPLKRFWGREITDRQKALIVKYFREGLAEKLIAEAIGISLYTVTRYVCHWQLTRGEPRGRPRTREQALARYPDAGQLLLVPGLGDRVRALRAAKNLSRAQLRDAGLRWVTVKRVDLHSMATTRTLVRLAVYLGCTLSDLVGEQ